MRERIHFIGGFKCLDDPALSDLQPTDYECLKCGDVLTGGDACYDHRKGILSDCRLNRLRALLR